ncbi:acyl carrier protein [Candidatus Coxiella mudrowiae]|uniref:acyl carrier protein n=1 Tax=Candidatus Coxiella mudrowiae TaxID=2054173 RepID=UPI0009E36E21
MYNQVCALIQQELVDLLGSSKETIDIHKHFSELGIDSLMAVELENRLQQNLGENVRLKRMSS